MISTTSIADHKWNLQTTYSLGVKSLVFSYPFDCNFHFEKANQVLSLQITFFHPNDLN
ncbi:hypothetical protein Hanom_Chr11g00976491 [Helianthus anomalus]